MSRLDPSARVRNHVIEILSEGPIRFEDLSTALVNSGLELGPDPDERVDAVLEQMNEISSATIANPDDPDELIDIVYLRAGLLDGTTWTIPVDELDIASDTLSSEALGLAFVALINGWSSLESADRVGLDMDGRRRAAAGELGVETDGETAVALPPGWLSTLGAHPGDYVQLRFDGEVILAEATTSTPEPTGAMIDVLVDVVNSSAEQSQIQATILTELLVTHDELRSVVLPPLDEWFEAAGLTRSGPMVAPVGFDFELEGLEDDIEDGIDLHGLKGPNAMAFANLMRTWHMWLSTDPPATGAPATGAPATGTPATTRVDDDSLTSAAAALDSIPVAAAFADVAFDEDKVDELVAFGERLIDLASGRHRAGPAWVIAQTLGRSGATDRFEVWVDTALAFDGEHPLSLYDKAWFEFDRGELRKAKALMSRLMMPPDSHDMALIDSVLASTGPTVGRNDPCPCGSGRKYKRCHLGVDEIPLGARLTLLYRKANRWLDYRHSREVHISAMIRAGSSGMSPAQLLETDPLIPDAVLTEGGRFEEWLAERGALLPSDEAMLASQWALVERSIYEVTEVRPDQGLTLRNIRTGDVVDVTERLGTRGMKPGMYILARPLPVGDDTFQFFGGMTTVPDSMLQVFIELLDSEPDAIQLLSLVAKSEAPPELRNTDGDDLVFAEMTWHVDDQAAARRVLDEAFEPDGNREMTGAAKWVWLAEPDAVTEPAGAGASTGTDDGPEPVDGRTVLGNITLRGDRMSVDTNSAERAERATELIAELLPDAVLVEDLRSTMDDLREDEAYENYILDDATGSAADAATVTGDALPAGMIDPTEAPPEIQAALRQQMNHHEERWVDESIPALGGVTPRQALDDPTRRDDLFRLLDRMEEMESRLPLDRAGLGMRTSRLRELLGL